MELPIVILCILFLWTLAILWKKVMKKSFKFHLFTDGFVLLTLFILWLISNKNAISLVAYGIIFLVVLIGVVIHLISPWAKRKVNGFSQERIEFLEEDEFDDGVSDRVVFSYALVKVFLILFYILVLFKP